MLTVRYQDQIVGRLAETRIAGRLAVFFEYAPEFVQTGIELSPMHLPLGPGVKSREGTKPCDELPGLFEDSLPDTWGQSVLFDWFARKGTPRHLVTPLMQLSYIGERGMGALSYQPEDGPASAGTVSLNQIYSDVLMAESAARFSDALTDVGSSAGGAQPKAVIGICDSQPDRRFISGTTKLPETHEAWLVKFSTKHGAQTGADGGVEYANSLMIRAAGIDMPPTRLLRAGNHLHFAVKRFDREQGRRIHHHTLSRLLQIPGADLDYQTFLRTTEVLTKDHRELVKAYRRAVFNVLARNDDDHGRNHGFLLRGNEWRLSPAYDVTFRRLSERGLAVCGERRNAGLVHLQALADRAGIDRATAAQIIDEVRSALSLWPAFADEGEVPATLRADIKRAILVR
jgi:serine/threonine-protein kinase HipA